MAFTSNPNDQDGLHDNRSLDRPPNANITSLVVGYSSVQQDRVEMASSTAGLSNLRSPQQGTTSATGQSSERPLVVDNVESIDNVQERQDVTGNVVTCDVRRRQELAAVGSVIPRSLRESDDRCETHNNGNTAEAVSFDDVIAVGIPANHTSLPLEHVQDLSQVASNLHLAPPIISIQESINPSNSLSSQPPTPNSNPISFEERMRRKGLERNFAPAVRIDRRPSIPGYCVDIDEEKEEVREWLSLSKLGDQADAKSSAVDNSWGRSSATTHTSHQSDENPTSGSMDQQKWPPTQSSNQSGRDDEDTLREADGDNDPVPVLPSIMEGDNRQRPGAYTAPGRAFGEFPVWGRSRPATHALNRNSSSSGSSSMRRSSDAGNLLRNSVLFSSIRAAATWLPTTNQPPRHESQGEDLHMVEAQAVDAEAVVYASDVRVDFSKRIIRTYTCAIAVSCLIIVVLAISLSLALTETRGSHHHQGFPAAIIGNSSVSSACRAPDTSLDVFTLCSCYNSTDKLVLTAEERKLYRELYFNFSERGLLSQTFNLTSCAPENQSLLWISNYLRLELAITDLAHAAPSHFEQFFALACLFVTTNGTGWKQNSGWLTNVSVCSWFGVSCGIVTRIMSIKLNSNGLTGTIPVAIRLLPFIQLLDLSGNPDMHGTLPSGLGNMTSLYQLDLSACNFTGTIPGQLDLLKRIEEISFEENKLIGSLPLELGALASLRTLSVRGNRLNGTIPTTLANLGSLGYLDLSLGLCRIF